MDAANPSSLVSRKCFNHADRESAARCPQCHRFFCRECVTDFAGKVYCAACLKQVAVAKTGHSMPKLWRLLGASAGVAAAWMVFYLIGRLLLMIPAEYHEGTIWTH